MSALCMSKYKSEIIWLSNHYSPTESYVLNGVWYGIIWQCQIQSRDSIRDEYKVKKVSLDHFYPYSNSALDHGVFIKYPENIYDTKGRARLAILLNANQDVWTGNDGDLNEERMG